MNIESIAEIIAERRIYMRERGEAVCEVIIQIGKPMRFVEPRVGSYVPYQILGIARDKVLFAGGEDAVQPCS